MQVADAVECIYPEGGEMKRRPLCAGPTQVAFLHSGEYCAPTKVRAGEPLIEY